MGDLISRDAAIEAINCCHPHCMVPDDYHISIVDAEFRLKKVPPAEPERKTGQWIRHNTYVGDDTSGYVDPDWRCSECGKQAIVNAWCMYDLTDFCPFCGADMRGEQNG